MTDATTSDDGLSTAQSQSRRRVAAGQQALLEQTAAVIELRVLAACHQRKADRALAGRQGPVPSGDVAGTRMNATVRVAAVPREGTEDPVANTAGAVLTGDGAAAHTTIVPG